MTAKSILTAIAAATVIIAGTSSFTPAAEAHGIRLGFGLPLGSFVAREYAPDSYQSRGHSSRRSRQHKSYAAARAARERESVRERAAVRAARARERQAEQSREVALARAKEKSEARRQMSKLKLKDEPATVAAAPQASQSEIAETALTELQPVKDVEVVKTVDHSTTAIATANTEPKAEPPKPREERASSGKADCKKFIPAVGVTISVGCN